MVVKRVSVNQLNKFAEDRNSPRYKEEKPMGELRKYVKDMKEQQQRIQSNSKGLDNFKAGKSIGGISVQGYATGGNFYPQHNLGSGGIRDQNFN